MGFRLIILACVLVVTGPNFGGPRNGRPGADAPAALPIRRAWWQLEPPAEENLPVPPVVTGKAIDDVAGATTTTASKETKMPAEDKKKGSISLEGSISLFIMVECLNDLLLLLYWCDVMVLKPLR